MKKTIKKLAIFIFVACIFIGKSDSYISVDYQKSLKIDSGVILYDLPDSQTSIKKKLASICKLTNQTCYFVNMNSKDNAPYFDDNQPINTVPQITYINDKKKSICKGYGNTTNKYDCTKLIKEIVAKEKVGKDD